jgi:hypothetical protein
MIETLGLKKGDFGDKGTDFQARTTNEKRATVWGAGYPGVEVILAVHVS